MLSCSSVASIFKALLPKSTPHPTWPSLFKHTAAATGRGAFYGGVVGLIGVGIEALALELMNENVSFDGYKVLSIMIAFLALYTPLEVNLHRCCWNRQNNQVVPAPTQNGTDPLAVTQSFSDSKLNSDTSRSVSLSLQT